MASGFEDFRKLHDEALAVLLRGGFVERVAARWLASSRRKERYEEVQWGLFRESGVNMSTSQSKIREYAQIMRQHRGWGPFPPIHGYVQTVDESDFEDWKEAVEDGYEHELAWSRPLTRRDVGTEYVAIEDGHNRAWAARKARVPIQVEVW